MFVETDACNLRRGKLGSLRIAPGIEGASNAEAGGGASRADKAHDRGVIDERQAGPVLAEAKPKEAKPKGSGQTEGVMCELLTICRDDAAFPSCREKSDSNLPGRVTT
jgi:hypothetical protein